MKTEHFVSLAGIDFHYVEWGGSAPNGLPPIILLHGLASTVHIWNLVAPRLSAHGQVWALDQRGHGLSGQPAGGYDFESIGQDLLRFVDALGIQEKFFLVGHSWGGYVALAFAQAHGERLQGAVLVDGGIMDLKIESPIWEIAEARMRPPAMVEQSVAEVEAMVKDKWLGPAWTPETGEMAFQCYKVDGQGFVDRRLHLANHMQIARAIWEFTPADHFADIHCPILLAVPIAPDLSRQGREMTEQPDAWQVEKQRQVRNAEAMIPDCQVVWFVDSIHDLPWQRPQLLAKTIGDFVDEHTPRGMKS